MYNKKIAEIFEEIADMLSLEPGDHTFESRAYQKAAVTISALQEDVGDIIEKRGAKALLELQGVGKTIAERINEYVTTGKIEKYEELKRKYPIDFNGLTKIEGLGSKKILRLYKELGVRNVDDLRKVVEQHKIRTLEGFGERSEEEIGKGLAMLESLKGRMLLGTALPEAERIVKRILESGYAEKARIAGSTRRMKETVGDLDILIVSQSDKIMDFVSSLPEVESTIVKGATKTTVQLGIGLTCDFRVVEDKSFGSAMQYFTGSKDHNILVRQIAIKKGYKLSEYGLFDSGGKQIAGKDERDVYDKLGMQYIEPEMREARGEIELAQHHKLPKLAQLSDILGDLHVHSRYSGDSTNTFEDIIAEAKRLGRNYVGITDHSKSEYINRGLDEKGYAKEFAEIDRINEKLDNFRLLKSGEVDILKDGSLDIDRKMLDEMDYVLASVHSGLKDPKDKMTKRIVDALNSGQINILGHPTGRLINEREPIQADLDRVFEAAKDNGVVMEINAQPSRLDLNDENIIKAREYGLKFSIDTDSHRSSHLEFMRYGVGVARRGWLTSKDVINTLDVKALLKLFHRVM